MAALALRRLAHRTLLLTTTARSPRAALSSASASSSSSSAAKAATAATAATAAPATAFEALLREHFTATGSLAGTPVRLVDAPGGVRETAVDDELAVIEALRAGPRGGTPASSAASTASGVGVGVALLGPRPSGPVLESFSIATLMRANVHLGQSTRAVHRNMLPYVAGERQGVHVIDLEQTQAALRRAVNVVREVAARGGVIVFVGTRPELADVMVSAAGRCAQYHVIHKWVPGTLTNMGETIGRRRGESGGRRSLAAGGDDGDFGGMDDDAPSDGQLIAQALQATVTRPDLLLLFDPLLNDIALREAERCHVPTIGLADTNFDPRRLTYPIPANDDSVLSVAYLASILANAALEGMLAASSAAAAAAAASSSGAGSNTSGTTGSGSYSRR